jgi:hypothetical protein
LLEKDVFSLPDEKVVEQLFRGYFISLHPLFPVLDETAMMQAFQHPLPSDKEDRQGKLSLLLAYAVMMAACCVSLYRFLKARMLGLA